MSNDEYWSKLDEILKVEIQVVAGTNYRIQFIMGTTTRKKENLNYDCEFNVYSVKQRCSVQVYSRPWENVTELTSYECVPIS